MPWFRVDDQLHGHPKGDSAGDAALGLWTRAGSYCMAYKRDGHVPLYWIKRQAQGTKKAAALVAAGLWHIDDDPEPGFRFHDWADIQETAEQIEAKRERGRERTKKWREAMVKASAKPDGDAVSDASRDALVTLPSSYSTTSTFTHGSSGETSAAASPSDRAENGGGGDDPEWERVLDRLVLAGIRPGRWSDKQDTEARALCARFGWVSLIDEAMKGTPPDVLAGCLARWRGITESRKASVVTDCPTHGPHETKVCVICHTAELRGDVSA